MTLIRTYRADLGELSASACFGLLHAAERQRALAMAHRHTMHEFVKTRALVRLLLSKHAGLPASDLEIATGACGKPYLSNVTGLHFNVSHSHGLALVAVASAPVGVDIERIDASVDIFGVARSVFSNSEIARLRATPGQRQGDVFFSMWTRKEAYLKATGLGFSSALPDITVPSTASKISDHTDSAEAPAWHAFDLPAPENFKAALVVAQKAPTIEVISDADITPLLARHRTSRAVAGHTCAAA
jgi:4'-phosphopantetheinyl transferase